MLRSFHIENFKSLSDFTMSDMGQFICLIGMNGAGKTAVIQAIDFVAHLAMGTVENWLKERDWTSHDLVSQLLVSPHINFRLEFGQEGLFVWEGCYDVNLGQCISEELRVKGASHPIFQMKDESLHLWRRDPSNPVVELYNFSLKGSILAVFGPTLSEYPAAQQALQTLQNTKSLELLAPSRMKRPSRISEDIGVNGETLAGFLHQLTAEQKEVINTDIRRIYPDIINVVTQSNPSGWAQLWALEAFGSGIKEPSRTLHTNAQHLNDGLLRVLLIIAQTKTNGQLLLFDEIDNGFNPEKIGQLVNYLLNAKQQIMVTTHNPLILNFLPDDKARESVFFLYRNRYGATKATRFFEIPEVAEKLEVLGPGEAFLDTSLEELVGCIEAREVVA